MKRTIRILTTIILFLFLFSPITTHAKSYHPQDTDITIELDDKQWYVFTRDNIKDNPELDELGLSYDFMLNAFNQNNAYLDALLLFEDGTYIELFIRKVYADSGIANFSNHDNDKILDFAKNMAGAVNATSYSTYQSNYKYAQLEYKDTNLNVYIYQYITVINKNIYSISLQSPTPFTEPQLEEFNRIVNTVHFDVDPSIKEKKDSDNFFDSIAGRTLIGAAVGGCAGGLASLVTRAIKKKKNNPTDIE